MMKLIAEGALYDMVGPNKENTDLDPDYAIENVKQKIVTKAITVSNHQAKAEQKEMKWKMMSNSRGYSNKRILLHS